MAHLTNWTAQRTIPLSPSFLLLLRPCPRSLVPAKPACRPCRYRNPWMDKGLALDTPGNSIYFPSPSPPLPLPTRTPSPRAAASPLRHGLATVNHAATVAASPRLRVRRHLRHLPRPPEASAGAKEPRITGSPSPSSPAAAFFTNSGDTPCCY